ncbi:MAG: hypothetical protein PHU34_02400 [Candidatus Methanoperedens sp.]|nr:hypothetical protein [Candidatus Methanoperedens sp.]
MDDVEIILEIDGKKIPMNGFVRKILCGMIIGSIDTLHGVENDWKILNISLRR